MSLCVAVAYDEIGRTTDGWSTASYQYWSSGSLNPPAFYGVTCGGAAPCYITGDMGTILASNDAGVTWVKEDSGTSDYLNGVSCNSATICSVVGSAQVAGAPSILGKVPCRGVPPQRAGGISPGASVPPAGYGFDGLYRLGDSGTMAAPTTGPAPDPSSPGPFAALGGVYADIFNCAPETLQNSTALSTSAWVMLQQFGNGKLLVQIGWFQERDGSHHTFVELEDRLTLNGGGYELCNGSSHFGNTSYLTCSSSVPDPPPGTYTYYTVEFQKGSPNDMFYFYMQQPGAASRQLVAQAPAHFTPNQAEVSGETHLCGDQMPGTKLGPEAFKDAHVFNQDGFGWENFYGSEFYNGSSVFRTTQTRGWYGLAASPLPASPHTTTGQNMKIWDQNSS